MDRSLPQHLQHRVRVVVDPTATAHMPGRYVLYWMHHAVRAHENPALDVAICLARQNGLPLLVYHALSEDYPYASDRHHTFILQGARDVQREMQTRGIAYYFHLQRSGHRGPHLRDLTREAAILVTEEMPVQPVIGWIERLASITTTPILSVDTACIVTPQLVPKRHTRAFQFRTATESIFEREVAQDYVEQEIDCLMFRDSLPFQPLNLQDVSLAELIAQCRIDHAVGPVVDTPGGTRAGYARWGEFKKHRLAQYARIRNDAAIHDSTSRLSAYLHYGMVSPFRIARESHANRAEKFLDELFLWRELAFHFCYHMRDRVDSIEAIPSWAKESLQQHQSDTRDEDFSWESLARGLTCESFWNLCQTSLLRHGELHNNLRMTWGKAILPWVKTPERALHTLIDLNHRYALDGRDPNSYGGILWCLGQFDRPFSPEVPVLGTVRPRSISEHASRLDIPKFRSIAHRPVAAKLPRVAIIGAGLGGLIAARTLQDHGIEVELFEKSRGVGGRMSTRRTDNELSFDHGAQYFTARDERFTKYVQSWIHDGIVAPWMGRIVELSPGGKLVVKRHVPRFVGTPTMNHVAKHLAQGLKIHLQTLVTSLEREPDDKWHLVDSEGNSSGRFDVVISNCPPPQSLALLRGHTDLEARISQIEMLPCWTMMIQSNELESLEFDGAFVNNFPISWIARDSSKPDRRGPSTWTVNASNPWSIEHLERSPADVQEALVAQFSQAIGRPIRQIEFCQAHRWRYAIPTAPIDEECLWDSTTSLGACGDWCGGPRIEGAFLSGMAMAGTLLRHLTIDRPAPLPPNKLHQPSLL